MFLKIFLFEIRYRFKRPATYAYFAIWFILALIIGIYGGGGGSEKVYVNSAYTIGSLLLLVSIFGMLIASAIMGVPIYRDIEYKTKDYFFAYPISEKPYLLGRYLGSFLILLFVSSGLPIGYLLGLPIGLLSGQIEPERLGPFVFQHYAYNFLIFTVPNLLFTGTLFFSLVALTRNIRVTYVASVILFIGYLLASALTRDLENKNLVDILDPFAQNTFANATKYWTPVERNTLLLPLEGNFLWNRLLWVGTSMLLLGFTFFRFSFKSMLELASSKPKKKEEVIHKSRSLAELPVIQKVFSSSIYLRKMLRQAVLEFQNIIKDVYFIAILLAGILFLFLDGWFGSPIFGTPSLPVTYYMLEVKDATYIIFVFIIIIFYTGEVVHRDKSVNYSNIADALPIPNWVMYGSKFLSLVLVAFLLVNLVWISGVFNQVLKGYFNFEFGMYFTDLYLIEFPEYIELIMLAFIVHILVNSKFVGHVVSIGIWVLMASLRSFAELDYNLFFFSYSPPYKISDMNGFGHFLQPVFWFHLYWLSMGVIFLVVGNLFWNRGSENAFQVRWKLAGQRLTGPIKLLLGVLLLVFVGSGIFIYYNLSVLNIYRRNKPSLDLGAEFEKKYKKYELTPQPKVVDAKINIDLYPSDRAANASGVFIIVNKTDRPIDSLVLNIGSPVPNTTIEKLKVGDADLKLLMSDVINRFYIYQMPHTMKPHDTLKMEVAVAMKYKGFDNNGNAGSILYNGTFINLSIFPSFGYPGDPLTSDKERKKRNLPKIEYTLPPQTDPKGLSNFLFGDDADWLTFETTISTEKDQLAISPGYLVKEWEANDRKYYQYKMDNKIDLFANFSSARYAVHRDPWTGSSGEKVNIEIFHHPSHIYNIDRLVKSVKASLDYYSKNFSPYQFRQMRILEFPRYADFAQSFPNTVPYAESFGWVGDFSDPDDTDYAFYVTAHEVAHQWWGHQVMPSATRGANQISESMAEYSALMVLKHEYGDECMQKFLKYSLDSYLRGRASENKFEATLLDNDSRAYVWYRKGSLILYALQDLMGEATMNKAFKTFVDSAAFRQSPPFATSNEWYKYIKAATPDTLQYFVEDSFEKIALYENRVVKATYQPDGKQFKVKLTVQTKKVYYDGGGKELDESKEKNLIDIGIFSADGKNDKGMTKKVPIYLKKHWLAPGEHVLEFVVSEKPVKAGIDPYNKLIDRIPDDNLKKVEE